MPHNTYSYLKNLCTIVKYIKHIYISKTCHAFIMFDKKYCPLYYIVTKTDKLHNYLKILF